MVKELRHCHLSKKELLMCNSWQEKLATFKPRKQFTTITTMMEVKIEMKFLTLSLSLLETLLFKTKNTAVMDFSLLVTGMINL